MAVAGRFQIESCDARAPEAPEQNTQVEGCIQDVVAQEFKLVGDVTRLRWSLLAYERSDASFRQQLCDVWAEEARQHCRQSLVIGDERFTAVFLHKPDQRQIKLEIADVKPACYAQPNPNNRHKHQQALVDVFGRLQTAAVLQTSMRLVKAEVADVKSLFEEFRTVADEDIHMEAWQAKQLDKGERERCPKRKALCTGQTHLFKARALERKRELQMQKTAGIVCQPGSDGATKLIYPYDVPGLVKKIGKTFCERARAEIEIPFADYMETRLHFEKVLVLWGEAGLAKSPAAKCIANYLAVSYNANYLVASSPEALRPAVEEFRSCVPVVFEELTVNDVSQHGRKLGTSFLKHLLNVRDGGQCRIRFQNLNFHPLMPRILCINDTPDVWLKAVEGIDESHEVPLKKRLLFVKVDEFALDDGAVEEHERDLDELVARGKKQRLEQHYGKDVESTTASGGSSPVSSTNGSEAWAPACLPCCSKRDAACSPELLADARS